MSAVSRYVQGVIVGLSVLSSVAAIKIDTHLLTIKNDCYERLAIGQRLDPRDVLRSLDASTVAECKRECSQEGERCLSLSFGIDPKGNGTCELSFTIIKETADLQPIGTVQHQDYDLYIKKVDCTLNVPPDFPSSQTLPSSHHQSQSYSQGNTASLDHSYNSHNTPADVHKPSYLVTILDSRPGNKPVEVVKTPSNTGYSSGYEVNDPNVDYEKPHDYYYIFKQKPEKHNSDVKNSNAPNPDVLIFHEDKKFQRPYELYNGPYQNYYDVPRPIPLYYPEKNLNSAYPQPNSPYSNEHQYYGMPKPNQYQAKPYLPEYERYQPYNFEGSKYDRKPLLDRYDYEPSKPYTNRPAYDISYGSEVDKNEQFQNNYSYDRQPYRPYNSEKYKLGSSNTDNSNVYNNQPYNSYNQEQQNPQYDIPHNPEYSSPVTPISIDINRKPVIDRPYGQDNHVNYEINRRPYYPEPEKHDPYLAHNYEKPEFMYGTYLDVRYKPPLQSNYQKPSDQQNQNNYDLPFGQQNQNEYNRPYGQEGQNYYKKPYAHQDQNIYKRPYMNENQNIYKRPYDEQDQTDYRRPYGRPEQNDYKRPYDQSDQNGYQRPYVQQQDNGYKRPYDQQHQSNYERPYDSIDKNKYRPTSDQYNKRPSTTPNPDDPNAYGIFKPNWDRVGYHNKPEALTGRPEKHPTENITLQSDTQNTTFEAQRVNKTNIQVTPQGGTVTSIITQILERPCYRRTLAGKRIARNFIKRAVPCESVEACQRECQDEKRFVCEGFNYRLDESGRGQGDCELTDLPLVRMDLARDVVLDRNYDFYEKDRNSGPDCRPLGYNRPAYPPSGPWHGGNNWPSFRPGDRYPPSGPHLPGRPPMHGGRYPPPLPPPPGYRPPPFADRRKGTAPCDLQILVDV